MRYLLFLLLLGCTPVATTPTDNPAEVYTQDMESCTVDGTTPWCVSACKDNSYSWCKK